jgi:hypothetical protein
MTTCLQYENKGNTPDMLMSTMRSHAEKAEFAHPPPFRILTAQRIEAEICLFLPISCYLCFKALTHQDALSGGAESVGSNIKNLVTKFMVKQPLK